MNQNELKILEMLAEGKITVEDANRLLEAIREERPDETDVGREEPPEVAHGSFFGGLTANQLVSMAALNVTPDYVDTLRYLGVSDLTPEQVVGLKGVGVTGDFVREMRDLGYERLTADQLISMKGVGIGTDFVQKWRGTGLESAR